MNDVISTLLCTRVFRDFRVQYSCITPSSAEVRIGSLFATLCGSCNLFMVTGIRGVDAISKVVHALQNEHVLRCTCDPCYAVRHKVFDVTVTKLINHFRTLFEDTDVMPSVYHGIIYGVMPMFIEFSYGMSVCGGNDQPCDVTLHSVLHAIDSIGTRVMPVAEAFLNDMSQREFYAEDVCTVLEMLVQRDKDGCYVVDQNVLVEHLWDDVTTGPPALLHVGLISPDSGAPVDENVVRFVNWCLTMRLRVMGLIHPFHDTAQQLRFSRVLDLNELCCMVGGYFHWRRCLSYSHRYSSEDHAGSSPLMYTSCLLHPTDEFTSRFTIDWCNRFGDACVDLVAPLVESCPHLQLFDDPMNVCGRKRLGDVDELVQAFSCMNGKDEHKKQRV